jgi:Uncharacterized protein conserved in bacteria (DUF2252)
VVAGPCNALSESAARAAARAASRTYRTALRRYASAGYLDVWSARIDVAAVMNGLHGASRRDARRVAKKARRHTSLTALDKLTTKVAGGRRIVDDPPAVEHIDGLSEEIAGRFADYARSLPADRRVLLDRYPRCR